MSLSRMKIIAIVALVFVNVFFLTLIIIDSIADARSERQAVENACMVLRAGGITIDPDDVKAGGALAAMRTSRGVEAEALIARAVLGDTVITDQGVIILYENESRGAAEFRSGGEFEIRLNEGAITNDAGALRTVQRLLRDMRIETSELILSEDSGNEAVTATSAYRGASIFNSTIEFLFNGNSLEIVRGRYFTGIEPVEGGAVMSPVGTSMLGFLAEVRNEDRADVVCTHIYSFSAGYRHRVVGSFGEGVIEPAWLVTTDAGRFIIDDATGEIWPLP